MNEAPDQITIGETTTWTKSGSSYPAPTYTLKYSLSGAGGTKTITAAASDANHLVSIKAAGAESLAALTAGVYTILGWFEKGSGDDIERVSFLKKTITLNPNLFSGTAADQSSIARQTLARLQAWIKNYATDPIESCQIMGRTWQRPTLDMLMKWEREYIRRVADEIAAENRALGKSSGRNIKIEFTTPV